MIRFEEAELRRVDPFNPLRKAALYRLVSTSDIAKDFDLSLQEQEGS